MFHFIHHKEHFQQGQINMEREFTKYTEIYFRDVIKSNIYGEIYIYNIINHKHILRILIIL